MKAEVVFQFIEVVLRLNRLKRLAYDTEGIREPLRRADEQTVEGKPLSQLLDEVQGKWTLKAIL